MTTRRHRSWAARVPGLVAALPVVTFASACSGGAGSSQPAHSVAPSSIATPSSVASSPLAGRSATASTSTPAGPPVDVQATGAVGRRSWQLAGAGRPAACRLQPLEASALEQGRAGRWFVVRADGRPSQLVLGAAAQPRLVRGRVVVTASRAATVQERTPLVVARWTQRDGVRSLRVEPVDAVRGWSTTVATDALWAEVLRQVPKAGTAGMEDQFACHVLFAPDKDAWYLEPARPAVGLPATVAARCNPGTVADGG